nr:DUF3368 domain-containing protein [Endozoicomonas sp.]
MKTLVKPSESSVVIADSSPLIALGISDLLCHFPVLLGEVWVPETVLNECLAKQGAPGFHEIQQAVNDRIIFVHPDLPESVHQVQLLSRLLDPGEAQAIALADQYQAVLLIDEKAGRSTAKNMGIRVTGSLAVLLKAKRVGVIPSVKSVVETLQHHKYRYSKTLIANVLAKARE